VTDSRRFGDCWAFFDGRMHCEAGFLYAGNPAGRSPGLAAHRTLNNSPI
jgi:hypothetical protein